MPGNNSSWHFSSLSMPILNRIEDKPRRISLNKALNSLMAGHDPDDRYRPCKLFWDPREDIKSLGLHKSFLGNIVEIYPQDLEIFWGQMAESGHSNFSVVTVGSWDTRFLHRAGSLSASWLQLYPEMEKNAIRRLLENCREFRQILDRERPLIQMQGDRFDYDSVGHHAIRKCIEEFDSKRPSGAFERLMVGSTNEWSAWCLASLYFRGGDQADLNKVEIKTYELTQDLPSFDSFDQLASLVSRSWIDGDNDQPSSVWIIGGQPAWQAFASSCLVNQKLLDWDQLWFPDWIFGGHPLGMALLFLGSEELLNPKATVSARAENFRILVSIEGIRRIRVISYRNLKESVLKVSTS